MCLCLTLAAALLRAETQATYQGKPLAAWIEAMRYDLDPDYRRAAMDAVAHFGALAIPRLSQMLNQDVDADSARIATMALIRVGPAGRSVVSDRLAREPKRPLIPVIDGISQSGSWARAFVPYLRTLVNAPEVSLIALRTLAQAESIPGPEAPNPQIERRFEGPGGSIFLTPVDCFVKGRFSSIRAGVSLPQGVTIKDVGLTFRSALNEAVYWTPARRLADDAAGRLQYEAFLPKIETLGLTTIAYSILVETSAGEVATDQVLAAISPSEEGCSMVGAAAAPEGHPATAVDVLLLSQRTGRKGR